jgi:hypothetical protein
VTLASLALLLGVVAVVGLASKHHQLGSNYVAPVSFLTVLQADDTACQDGETVPKGTGALRVYAGTYAKPGPPLTVTVSARGLGRHTGAVASGWTEPSVVVPLSGAELGGTGARVCVRNHGHAPIALTGNAADPSVGLRAHGQTLSARMRLEYTPAKAQSWWSMLPTLADRAGAMRGAFPSGATLWLWIALLALVVAGAVAAVLTRRRAALMVTGVALLNALAWGLITPPFQVPDEPAHFYYASYLARTGELPQRTSNNDWYSPEQNLVLGAMEFYRVIGVAQNRQPFTPQAGRYLDAVQHAPASHLGRGDAATATDNSPEYYAFQAAAYSSSPWRTLLGRLTFMRLLAAMLSALTVACVFGFLRELLPSSPWAWTAGALAAALQPLFGFVSSGVNNDGLLYLSSAFVLMMLARCFHRGLTPTRGALLGLGLGVGVLAKTQLIAYVPAVALALALLVLRPPRGRVGARGTAWTGAAAAVAVGIVPLAVYFVLGHTLWHRPPIDRISAATGGGSPATLSGQFSYLWQLYLPRLPFMNDLIPGFPLRRLWGDGLMGRLGWLDYGFPGWVNVIGELLVVALFAGAVAMLVRHRGRTRSRLGELGVYGLVTVALCAAISWVGYRSRLSTGTQFEQARYLLPLLPFYAGAVALAVRLAGRRWGPVVCAVVAMLVLGHTVFAQLLTLSRYYG